MIISKIIGGLGNQMFQYATGRAVALARGQSLHLDISSFEKYKMHQGFELQRIFACPIKITGEDDISNILGWQHFPLVRRILGRSSMSLFRRNSFVVEPYFHYWPGIKNIPDNCYLAGCWQSDKYFSEVADTIRSDFSFKAELSKRNTDLVEEINQVNAVSLHVRRGDYVNNKKNVDIHGVCSLDYYQKAIQYIVDQVVSPYFFVFSDDMVWVKDKLKINFPCQFIDHNQGADSYVDMRLMSLCKHHIIANSTFSWWGAWLNSSANKLVICPRKWFANENDTKDLYPQGWVTL